MISKIDTIQISTDKCNFRNIDEVNKDNKPYIVKTHERGNKIFIGLHVSRTQGTYNHGAETYTYKYFMEQLRWIYKDLGVIDLNQVKIDRVDYCFDYEDRFEDLYKLNNILVVLYGLEIKADFNDMIECNTILEQKKTSLSARNVGRTKQILVYDKKTESKNRHPYSTRQEMRVMRLDNKSIQDAIQVHYDVLDRLESNFYSMEQIKIQHLYELYQKELNEGKVHSFTAFVTRYNEQIVTRRICEELHRRTGHTGKFKNWLKEYRKRNVIEFISKEDVRVMISEMRKSMRSYMGTTRGVLPPFFSTKNRAARGWIEWIYKRSLIVKSKV